MKRVFLSAALILALGTQTFAQKYFDKAKVKTTNDSLSYSLGYMLSQNLIGEGVTDYDPVLIGKAFKDSKENGSPLMTIEECKEVLRVFFEKKETELKESQLAKEKEFLEANAKKEGVKVTESGLQYKVLKEGRENGKTPGDSDNVKIHYEGRLIDGSVFDTSYDSEEPAELGMEYIIPGMQEALKLMKEGAEYTFYIPQNLGYGEYSPGESLPAYSTLIFDIQLVSVEPQPEDEDEDSDSKED